MLENFEAVLFLRLSCCWFDQEVGEELGVDILLSLML